MSDVDVTVNGVPLAVDVAIGGVDLIVEGLRRLFKRKPKATIPAK